MFAVQFSENVRLLAVLKPYRIIAYSRLALAGLSCFQHGEVNMFPVHIMKESPLKPNKIKTSFWPLEKESTILNSITPLKSQFLTAHHRLNIQIKHSHSKYKNALKTENFSILPSIAQRGTGTSSASLPWADYRRHLIILQRDMLTRWWWTNGWKNNHSKMSVTISIPFKLVLWHLASSEARCPAGHINWFNEQVALVPVIFYQWKKHLRQSCPYWNIFDPQEKRITGLICSYPAALSRRGSAPQPLHPTLHR